MVQDVIDCDMPVDYDDCRKMGACFNCSVFLRAAAGDTSYFCHDAPKMLNSILEFYERL